MMALIMVLTMSGTVLSCIDGFSYATGENTVQEQDPDAGAGDDADADTDTDTETGSGLNDNSGADDASAEEEKNKVPESKTGGKMTAKGGAVLVSGTWPKNDSTDTQTNTWTIDEEGVMTLSGSGRMTDYSSGVTTTPWSAYRRTSTPYIRKLVVEPGITYLAQNLLTRTMYLDEIDASGCGTLSGTQGADMFKATGTTGEPAVNSILKRVDFSGNAGLEGFGQNAFANCNKIEYIDISDTKINSANFTSPSHFGACTGTLKTLYAKNCSRFTNVNLSSYTALETVDLRGCSGINELKFSNSGSSKLKALYLPDCVKKDKFTCPNISTLTIYFDGTYSQWRANGFTYRNGKWNNVNVVFASVIQITDSDHNILYYGSEPGQYEPAQFNSLKEAHDVLNGELYADDEGSDPVTGPVIIEVRAEEYELKAEDNFTWSNSRHVTIEPEGSVESCVIRPGESAGQYMFNLGSADVTFENITIDGNDSKGIAALTDSGSKLTLDSSAKLVNGKAENGGAVNIAAGSLTMNDGAGIKDCSATGNGGAVNIGAGSLTMNDGAEIKDCSATGKGSAIYLGGGTFAMEGGSISGCAPSSDDDGAVYAASGNAKLEFGGSEGAPAVTGNKRGDNERNVYIAEYSDSMIKAAGSLSDATIGLYIAGSGHHESGDIFGSFDEGVEKESLTGFRNDRTKVNGISLVGWGNDSKKIFWASPVKVKYVEKKNDGTYASMPSLDDTAFILGDDKFYSNEDIMEQVRGEGKKTPPVISDDCYFHYFGLGPDTAPDTGYDELDEFYLKQGNNGVHYSEDGSEDKGALPGVNTVYVIYSRETPAGSANLNIDNQTAYVLTVNSIYTGEEAGQTEKATAVITDSSGHLSLLDETTGEAVSDSLSLVILKGDEKQFEIHGGYKDIEQTDDLAIKVNISGSDEIYVEKDDIKDFGSRVKGALQPKTTVDPTVAAFTAETSDELNIYKIWNDDSDGATHDKSSGTEKITLQFLDENGDPVRVRASANADNDNFDSADERERTVTLKKFPESSEWDPNVPLKVVVPDTAAFVTELAVPGYICTNEVKPIPVADGRARIENTRAVCKITYEEEGKTIEQPFATMKDAMAFAQAKSMNEPVIEMLLDYSMPATDSLDIPAGYKVTVTTAGKGPDVVHKYSGDGDTATIRRKSSFTSGSMFVNYYQTSTLVMKNVILDGEAYGGSSVSADSAMITNGGSLEIREDSVLKNAVSTGNGGAIYSTGGSITIEKTSGSEGDDPVIKDNTAANGGAIYIREGSIDIKGGVSVTGNTSSATGSENDGNGGAIYIEDGDLSIEGGVKLNGNTAGGKDYDGTTPKGRGGAVYAEKGSVTFVKSGDDAPEIKKNRAGNGGAVYLNEASAEIGEDVIVGGASADANTATTSGGAIYAVKGLVSVDKNAAIKGNAAQNGNGGAIYSESGVVELQNGMTLSGNSAEGSETAGTGRGGAVYAGSGKITMYGGTISGNEASNGSAIYIESGTAEMNGGSVSDNTATDGGAVSTGEKDGKEGALVFAGSIKVRDNKKGSEDCNVFLDKDSDTMITADILGDESYIGVYVDGPLDGDLFKKRGQAGCRFATFNDTGAANLANFHNDRQSGLKAMAEANVKKVIWSSPLDVIVRYLPNYGNYPGGFPPVAEGTEKYNTEDLPLDKKYYPSSSTLSASQIADDLYEVSGITAPATFGGAYIKGEGDYAKYIKRIYWDSNEDSWMYETRSGSHKVDNTLVIYYSDPAYISIENNWKEHKLNISDISINGMTAVDSAGNAGYGYVVAKNGMTKETLDPIHKNSTDRTKDDLYLKPGESVKLLFPGACGKDFNVLAEGSDGGFDNLDAGNTTKLIYTDTSSPEGESEEDFTANTDFPVSKTTLSTAGDTFEVIFGGRKQICKVVDANGTEHPFTRIEKALTFIQSTDYHPAVEKTAAIEMLVDYLIPSSDHVVIPAGYDITLKTAAKTGGQYNYEGEGDRATISRDTNNAATLISNNASANNYPSLTIDGIIFDGRNIAGSTNGGAVSTKDCKVTVKDSEFKNFKARQGAALYVDYTINGATYAAGDNMSILTVDNTDFSECHSETTALKEGGGAIWTTARELLIGQNDRPGKYICNRCGYIYDIETGDPEHGVNPGTEWADIPENWKCPNCEAVKDQFEREGCDFYRCTASDQAGAVFHNILKPYATGTKTVMKYCTFEACEAKAAGAVETDAEDVRLEYSSAKNCKATQRNGGAFNIYSRNESDTQDLSKAAVIGCTFEDCHADDESRDNYGGGLRIAAKTEIRVEDCTFTNCSSKTGGAFAISNKNAETAIINGCTFNNCRSAVNGGGIYSLAKDITIGKYIDPVTQKEKRTSVNNCTATNGVGGGICLLRNIDGSIADLSYVTIQGCNAAGSREGGGGLYVNLWNVTVSNSVISENTSATNGGGVYDNAEGKVLIFDNCTISGNTAANQGGGVFTKANMTIRNNTMISGNSLTSDSKDDAAGVFMQNGRTLTVGAEGSTETDNSSIMDNATSSGARSNLRLWADNNGRNNVASVRVYSDLGGKIYVINAAAKGTQFGTSFKPGNADPTGFTDLDHVFEADDGSLYGIIHRADSETEPADSKKRIIWAAHPVCKVTDKDGNLLYLDEAGKTRPAVFDLLDDRSADGKPTSAFNLLRNNSLQLYKYNGEPYDGNEYCVKMLVEEYEAANYMVGGLSGSGTKITLTTESRTSAVEGDPYPYRGKPGTKATIKRSPGMNGNNALLEAKTDMDLTGIVLDGNRKNVNPTADTRILMVRTANVNVLIGKGAILQNADLKQNGSGVALNHGTLTIDEGGIIRNCHATANGGGVYIANSAKLKLINGKITGCESDAKGGGVYHNSGSAFEMSGGSISGCEAFSGGGLFLEGSRKFDMSGGEITGNKADEKGGGIAVHDKNSRIYLSGKVMITGNKVGRINNNIHLDVDSNDVINSVSMDGTRGITDPSSVIGVYVPDGPLLPAHGVEGAPFGTNRNTVTDAILLRCFVNDRGNLVGGIGQRPGIIYWVHDFSLKVSKTVNSDKASDKREQFTFFIYLLNKDGTAAKHINGTYGDITFRRGTANITLRSGDSRTAASLPAGLRYVVSENQTSLYQGYYTTYIEKGPSKTVQGTVTSGSIGENLEDPAALDRYQSLNHFVNSHTSATRRVIIKKVNSGYTPVSGRDFYVFRNSDSDYAVDGNGNTLNPRRNGSYQPLTSLSSSGVIWTGELPYGDYYLREDNGRWFYLIVDGKGTTKLNTSYGSYSEAKTALEAEKRQRNADD